MAVAVALLFVENLGALAYREHAVAASVANVEGPEQMRRIDGLTPEVARACENGKVTHCGPVDDRSYDMRRILEMKREIEAKQAEIQRLTHRAAELQNRRCDFE
jgi:hypothetical protein